MCNFSKKYNIKLENKNDIISFLSSFNDINKEEEYKINKLYFINKDLDLNKVSDFSDISDYAVITSDDLKKEVKIYNNKIYAASLTDVLSTSKLLYIYGYEVIFSINKMIYKYSYKNIKFYIQYIKNKGYFLTFNEGIKKEKADIILNLFKDKYKCMFDSNIYHDLEDEIFKENK